MDYANTTTGYADALAAAGSDASRLWIDGAAIRVMPLQAPVNLPARVIDADDFGSIQEALDRAGSMPGGACVQLPPAIRKIYPIGNSAALRVPDGVYLVGTPGMSELLLITDGSDGPGTSVWWDAVLFAGARSRWSGIFGVRIRHQGGRRNNAASIAVRGGASRVEIINNDIDGSIASAIVIEGSVPSPYPTYCSVRENKIANTIRHGVYLSGATHNRVIGNFFFTTRLESIALRNCHDNDVLENMIVGDAVQYPPHAIALAAPPSGIYVVARLNISENKMIGIPGAGFYGQGVGATLVDSTISENTIRAMSSPDSISHSMMFYRLSGCKISRNKVIGGRNRGMMFYGCSENDVTENVITNTNESGGTVGTMMFGSYTDPKDASTTNSVDNKITRNRIIDDRAEPMHVYGIQFLPASCENYVDENVIRGQTSLQLYSAEGLGALRMPVGRSVAWYCNDMPLGTNAPVQIPVIGDTYQHFVTGYGWIRAISIITRQVVASGELRVVLYKNGSAFRTVFLTGNASDTLSTFYDYPRNYEVRPGDKLTAFAQSTDMTSGQASIDLVMRVDFVGG